MKTTVVAALAAALMSSGAYAADVFGRDSLKDSGPASVAQKSWQGPYVAIGGGYRWHNWDSASEAAKCLFTQDDDQGNSQHSAGDTPVQFDGKKSSCHGYENDSNDTTTFVDPVAAHDEDSDTWVITGRLGHDWQSGRVVFGVFGEANWLDASTRNFTDTELLYGGGSRLGYLFTDRLLAYVNAGVELTDYSGLDTKVDPFVGGGLELLLADGWSIAGEGRWTFADDGELPANVSNNDPVTARVLLVKKF